MRHRKEIIFYELMKMTIERFLHCVPHNMPPHRKEAIQCIYQILENCLLSAGQNNTTVQTAENPE